MERTHVFRRRISYPHPQAVRGEGVYLYDQAGRRYIDASGGPVVVNIGHGVKEVAAAMAAQAGAVAYVHGATFTTAALERYAGRLAGLVPLGDARFYFLTSGSEAVEAALKFARQLQVARGEAGRDVTIARWGSYHGATLGALAVSGKPSMRNLYAPLFRDQPHIPAPYCYRCAYDSSYPGCGLACAQALEEEIKRQGPGRVAAFLAEPVGGATLGAVVPPPEYWPRVREICDRYGILLIADEVMTGFGRTGRWFAMEHWGVRPDAMVMGKGATGGYFPLSILAVRRADVETIVRAHGDFNHGGTFSHHAVGGAAALATLDYLESHHLVAAAARQGAYLGQRLQEALGRHPCVGEVRGIGMLWAVEYVADRQTKEPFSPQAGLSTRLADLAFERGVLLYPGHGGADGLAGDHLMVAPPFVASAAEIDQVVDVLAEVTAIATQRAG